MAKMVQVEIGANGIAYINADMITQITQYGTSGDCTISFDKENTLYVKETALAVVSKIDKQR
jgi:hypothetical protein